MERNKPWYVFDDDDSALVRAALLPPKEKRMYIENRIIKLRNWKEHAGQYRGSDTLRSISFPGMFAVFNEKRWEIMHMEEERQKLNSIIKHWGEEIDHEIEPISGILPYAGLYIRLTIHFIITSTLILGSIYVVVQFLDSMNLNPPT